MVPKVPESNAWKLSVSDGKLLSIMFRNMETKPMFDHDAIAREYGFANASTAAARCGQITTKLRNMAVAELGLKAVGSSSTSDKPAKSPKTPRAAKGKKHAKDEEEETPSKKMKVEGDSNSDKEAATNEMGSFQPSTDFKKEDTEEESKLEGVDDFNQAS